MSISDDNINMNRHLVELFGIPSDAYAATLRMRHGQPPTITVMKMIFRTGQLNPLMKAEKFRLVRVID